MRTAHHMLASIAAGILLVRCETFHLHDGIFMLHLLTKNRNAAHMKMLKNNENLAIESPICNFDQFKLILLSLFGERL